MTPMFAAPAGALDGKPPHGQPCNRCGLCCKATLCPLAQRIFRRAEYPGPCPALKLVPGGYGCGVVANPRDYDAIRTAINGEQAMRDAALLLIGSGTGCDARFNGEPADEAFYAELHRWDRANASKVKRAKKLWGIR